MPLRYTDSHCHLDWFDDPAAITAEAQAAGVARIVIAATTRAHWADVARCAVLPGVYASYGLHPLYQDGHQDDDLHALESQIQNLSTVAIGECGLDFLNGDSAAQRATFAAQIDIARRYQLPLLLHARKSLDAVLHLLKRGGNPRFIIHSFTGSDAQLARILAQGGYIVQNSAVLVSNFEFLRYACLLVVIQRHYLERVNTIGERHCRPAASVGNTRFYTIHQYLVTRQVLNAAGLFPSQRIFRKCQRFCQMRKVIFFRCNEIFNRIVVPVVVSEIGMRNACCPFCFCRIVVVYALMWNKLAIFPAFFGECFYLSFIAE